jgi:hypothetical protein
MRFRGCRPARRSSRRARSAGWRRSAATLGFGMESQVFKKRDRASGRCARPDSATGPTQSPTKCTGSPVRCCKRLNQMAQRQVGFTSPPGLSYPAITATRAPRSARSRRPAANPHRGPGSGRSGPAPSAPEDRVAPLMPALPVSSSASPQPVGGDAEMLVELRGRRGRTETVHADEGAVRRSSDPSPAGPRPRPQCAARCRAPRRGRPDPAPRTSPSTASKRRRR